MSYKIRKLQKLWVSLGSSLGILHFFFLIARSCHVWLNSLVNSDFVYEKWYYFQSAAFILCEITNYFVSNDTSYSVRIHTVCMLLELETNLSCIDKC